MDVIVSLLHPDGGKATPLQVAGYTVALMGVCMALQRPLAVEMDGGDSDVAARYTVPVADEDQGDAVLWAADVLAQAVGCGFAGAGPVSGDG